MKRACKAIMALVVLGVLAGALWWGYDRVFMSPEVWYAQVDASCLTKANENNNDFPYHYDLLAANEEGREETLGFDVKRELRDGAYLRLETLMLRGVISWEEVSWEEIPAGAQEHLPHGA